MGALYPTLKNQYDRQDAKAPSKAPRKKQKVLGDLPWRYWRLAVNFNLKIDRLAD
jgi:hypothetical protein